MAEKRGINASQARDSRLNCGKISTSSIPLKTESRSGPVSLRVRFFTNTGLLLEGGSKIQKDIQVLLNQNFKGCSTNLGALKKPLLNKYNPA